MSTDNVSRVTAYPLLEALAKRRSRRFALGMKMDSGPLAYHSRHQPLPLTEEEEALLVFAGSGMTGYALLDLPFAEGQGGAIVARSLGRTFASGDAIQTVSLIVANDDVTYLIKRPQDFSPNEIHALIDQANKQEFTDLYRRMRVKIKEGRAAPPLAPMFNVNVNRWSLYAPGTTYFLPINELTFMYINGLLEIFNRHSGAFVIDERAGFRPAGLGRFARSKGGHLHDDPADGRVLTVQRLELMVAELVTVEQGMMLQNLALMCQAMGLGGFPNFAEHEFSWFEALGFRMGAMPAARYLGAGALTRTLMSLVGSQSKSALCVGTGARRHEPAYALLSALLRNHERRGTSRRSTPNMDRRVCFAAAPRTAHGANPRRSPRAWRRSAPKPSMRQWRTANTSINVTADFPPTCRRFARCWDFRPAISTRSSTSATIGAKRCRIPSADTWKTGTAETNRRCDTHGRRQSLGWRGSSAWRNGLANLML